MRRKLVPPSPQRPTASGWDKIQGLPDPLDSWARTQKRVLHYVNMCGGVVLEATGGAVYVDMPDQESVVDLCTLMGRDAAEFSTRIAWLARDLKTVARALEWVQTYIPWRDEPGERLTYPTETLDLESGDCDDVATLMVALCSALGYPSFVGCCTLDDMAAHGVCAVQLHNGADGWFWADASEPGNLMPYARHPLTRDARTGKRGVIVPRLCDAPAWR